MAKEKKRKKPGPPPTGHTPKRTIRVSDDEWSEWLYAADKRGQTISELMRETMNRTVKRINK